MTLCAKCFKDRPGGGIDPRTGDWVCGRCEPIFAAGAKANWRPNPGVRGRP